MKAGAAMTDITPQAGTHLAGDVGGYRPCQSVLDPLHAKAVVFKSNGKKLCFLSLDVTIITKEHTDRIREGAAKRFGFDPNAIMVHATQTHSAPSVGHFMMDEGQPFRVGQTAFVGLPGEPFVEAQLAIKIASPAYPTYVAHCRSQYVAYLPPRGAYARKGHEVFSCKVEPGSLEAAVEAATKLLKELFP